MEREKKVKARRYLKLSLYAFLGLSIDGIVMMIGYLVTGKEMTEYTELQKYIHLIVTCILWAIYAFVLCRVSQNYGFDLMKRTTKPTKKQIIIVILLSLAGITEMTISFGGFKPWIELRNKEVGVFIVQYIYYMLEAVLFLLILIFGQKFGEDCFKRSKIPYGGIVLALTWGAIHFLSKNLVFGIESMVFSLVFGIIYLCLNKNTKLTYIFCACIFML